MSKLGGVEAGALSETSAFLPCSLLAREAWSLFPCWRTRALRLANIPYTPMSARWQRHVLWVLTTSIQVSCR